MGRLFWLAQETQEPPVVTEMQVVATACPECSYLEGGTCHWCENGDDHPGCDGCVDRKHPSPPWYKRSEYIVPILVSVVTGVATAWTVAWVMKEKGSGGAQAS